jgi:hypothetical protein
MCHDYSFVTLISFMASSSIGEDSFPFIPISFAKLIVFTTACDCPFWLVLYHADHAEMLLLSGVIAALSCAVLISTDTL